MDEDLRQELDTHVALIEEEERRNGLTAEQARRYARARFGNALMYREQALDAVIATWFEDAWKDARFAARVLVRAPGFSTVAVLTMALGIGANAAIFSVVSGVLLRPLPYPQSERLMYVTTQFPALGSAATPLSAPEYLEFRAVNRSFAVIGALRPGAGEVNLTAPDGARRVRSVNVDEYLLDALGLQPAQGRLFARGETDRTAPDAPLPPLAILSHELWQSAFGGKPIIGHMVEVNALRREVIGIMPPGADVMDYRTEIWLPLGLNPLNPGDRRSHSLRLIGRLKDQVTAAAAQAELKTLNEEWGERVGVTDHMFAPMPADAASRASTPDAGHVLQMVPLHDQLVSGASRAIWMLQATAGLVLLIACANLANLLLARAALRHREFAVRTALGASHGRLLRQLIIEGLLLSTAGSALALWLARFRSIHTDAGLSRCSAPVGRVARRSSRVAVYLRHGHRHGHHFRAGAASAHWRKGLAVALMEAGNRGAVGAVRRHVRRGLVVAEVALAVILVIGAGLLIRTVYNLANVEMGFDKSRLVTFSISLPDSTLSGAEQTNAGVPTSPRCPARRAGCRGGDGNVRAAAEFARPQEQYPRRRDDGSVARAVPNR
jgi:predicted permease